MSIQTNPDLRRSVIYELYVRSHTPRVPSGPWSRICPGSAPWARTFCG